MTAIEKSAIAMNKQKLDEAFAKRDEMEKRMKEIINYLNQPSWLLLLNYSFIDENGSEPVGLHGNLLNEDGYPRNDIDIIKVYTIRG